MWHRAIWKGHPMRGAMSWVWERNTSSDKTPALGSAEYSSVTITTESIMLTGSSTC